MPISYFDKQIFYKKTRKSAIAILYTNDIPYVFSTLPSKTKSWLKVNVRKEWPGCIAMEVVKTESEEGIVAFWKCG